MTQTKNRNRVVVVVACAALSGCATSKDYAALDAPMSSPSSETSGAGAGPATPAAEQPFRPEEFVALYPRPNQCEAAARELRATSADKGWAALKACITRTRFTLIRELAHADWAADLQKKPDAPLLLARVIANRGGAVAEDLKLLHTSRVPIFTLAAALAQPDIYKGRYVMLRAKVEEVRGTDESATIKLAEFSLGADTTEVEVGPKYKSNSSYGHSSSASASGAGRMDVATTRYGSASARGKYQSNYNSSSSGNSEYSSSKVEKRFDNVSMQTGREALGRLKKVDAFLEPGKELVVLARFDGVRMTPKEGEEEEVRVALLNVVAYQEPEPLVVY